jgi:hypothetical protein
MRFRCLTCDKTIRKSYDVDRVQGDLLGRPWYIDDTGLKHVAIVCLNCGTIHDCSGSLVRGLLSGFMSPLEVHHDMNPMELGVMIMASTTDPSASSRAFAIDELWHTGRSH